MNICYCSKYVVENNVDNFVDNIVNKLYFL